MLSGDLPLVILCILYALYFLLEGSAVTRPAALALVMLDPVMTNVIFNNNANGSIYKLDFNRGPHAKLYICS